MVYQKHQAEERDPFLSQLISARHAKSLTTRKLAQMLDISPAFVSLVETGQKTPSEEMALEWAKLLDINPKLFVAWVHSKQRRDPQTVMQGQAELRYWQANPNVEVRMANLDQITFESAEQQSAVPRSHRVDHLTPPVADALRVPLIPEGEDPASELEPLEYVTVQKELLQGEKLLKPFAYRLSPVGVQRVFKTLHPGDYAVISRDQRPLERDEIYAVKMKDKVVLGRVIEKGSDMLLLRSDAGEADIDALRAEGGKARSLVVGKVVAAIRALGYSVVKPSGGGSGEK